MNVKQNNLDVLHGYAGITTLLQFHFITILLKLFHILILYFKSY